MIMRFRFRALAFLFFCLASTVLAKDYMLVVGVKEYKVPSFPDLQYTIEDADQVRNLFRQTYGFVGPPTLKNPSIGVLRNEVLKVCKMAKGPDDTILIYFSGHGFLGPQGEQYLAASDISDPNLNYKAALKSALPIETELNEYLQESKAGKIVVIVDACWNNITDGPKSFVKLSTPSNAGVYARSCSAGEQSWQDPDYGSSVFTHFLVDHLRDGQGFSEENIDDIVSDVKSRSFEKDHVQTPYIKSQLKNIFRDVVAAPIQTSQTWGVSLPKPIALSTGTKAEYEDGPNKDESEKVAFYVSRSNMTKEVENGTPNLRKYTVNVSGFQAPGFLDFDVSKGQLMLGFQVDDLFYRLFLRSRRMSVEETRKYALEILKRIQIDKTWSESHGWRTWPR